MSTEADLVARIAAAFTGLVAEGAHAFADDAASLPPVASSPGGAATRVVTADQLIEGRHFRPGLGSPEDAGWRAIARNVSDLAASAARPVGFVWTLALPAPWLGPEDPLDGFLRGAAACARAFGLSLYGGDVAQTDGPFLCSVTAFGDAVHPLSRRGACVGDGVWVSRPVGGAAAGLAHLLAGGQPGAPAAQLHLRPQPELGFALTIAERATACIDVSDGLAVDLARLCRASGVGATLDALAAAIAEEAGEGEAARERALHGGDDYALLFTWPSSGPEAGPPPAFHGDEAPPSRAIRIGRITASPGLGEETEGGLEPIAPRGFDHFGVASAAPQPGNAPRRPDA